METGYCEMIYDDHLFYSDFCNQDSLREIINTDYILSKQILIV